MTQSHSSTVRIAAVGDIHCSRQSQGKLQPLFIQANEAADILLLCGDLTDYGLLEEVELLVKEIEEAAKIPIVAVLGNHDFESNEHERVKEILIQAGIHLLDGNSCEIHGVGFAGVKGFGGGFGRRALGAWGERAIKLFVEESLHEASKFERALKELSTPYKIGVLHYSPIQATVEGEPPDIFPFVGSSHLELPLLRYPVQAVFHGHAHKGQVEGKTSNGIPVFNVALPLLQRTYPNQAPFKIFEVMKTKA